MTKTEMTLVPLSDLGFAERPTWSTYFQEAIKTLANKPTMAIKTAPTAANNLYAQHKKNMFKALKVRQTKQGTFLYRADAR